MVAAKKTADASPAEPAAVPGDAPAALEQPVETEPATAVEAPSEDAFRPPVDVVFHGQAQSLVALVGLCEPGGTYTVPAAVADEVCGGDVPVFARAEKA